MERGIDRGIECPLKCGTTFANPSEDAEFETKALAHMQEQHELSRDEAERIVRGMVRQ